MKTGLFRIELLTDVYADACLRDEAGRLLFLSCFGRDTSMQQMFAAFSLPPAQGGITTLNLVREGLPRQPADVGDAGRLGKLTGRLPKDNLFGNLVHTWVFDTALQAPDYANRQVWLIDRRQALSGDLLVRRIWEQYEQLSPVPLLPHWQAAILESTWRNYVTSLDDCAFPPLGDIAAYRIRLGDTFLDTVSDLVKRGVLNLDAGGQRLAA